MFLRTLELHQYTKLLMVIIFKQHYRGYCLLYTFLNFLIFYNKYVSYSCIATNRFGLTVKLKERRGFNLALTLFRSEKRIQDGKQNVQYHYSYQGVLHSWRHGFKSPGLHTIYLVAKDKTDVWTTSAQRSWDWPGLMVAV